MRTGRFYAVVVAVLAGLVVLTHVLGATVLRSTLWGANLYAFLPAAILPAALVLMAGAIAFAWFARHPRRQLSLDPPASGAAQTATIVLAVIVSLALFWWLRIRHTLLGDSGPLSHNLPLGERSHHLQPLSLLLHHYAYEWTRGLFAAAGKSPDAVAFDAVALDSVIAGAVFVPVALALGRQLVATSAEQTRAALLAAALVLAQGYVQLFFGYVENYTWFTLMLALYLWAGLAFLTGRPPLILAALPLMIGIALNLSGVVLLPSLGVLAGWGLLRPERRAGVVRDIVLTLLVLLGLHVMLARLGRYDTLTGLRYMWDLVVGGEAMERHSLTVLFSPPHLRDFFAIHLLIGPFAGLLLVPVALHRVFRGGVRDTRLLFLLACALPPLLASWTYGDSIQGLPRDWDLFAPFALLYAAAAIYCIASEPIPAERLRRLLAVAAIVSLFHTGAWIALNTSPRLSLERYKTLPATRGRTQMVVAYWYLNHGQTELAREWFERSVAAYPANNASQYELGLFDMDAGRYDSAANRFWIATRSRPDKSSYRLALVDAVVLAGHPEAAVPQLELLIHAEPARAQYWACAGVVFSGVGRIAEARHALEQAIALEPTESRYVKLRERLEGRDAYARALRDDWDALVLK